MRNIFLRQSFFAVLLAVVAGCYSGVVWEKPTPETDKRLADAAKGQKAAADELSSMERDIVLLANFERDDNLQLADGASLAVDFSDSHYRPGRFGRGFLFEREARNLLPADVADIEDSTAGCRALGRATMSTASSDSAFGGRALSLEMPGAGDGVESGPFTVEMQGGEPNEKVFSLMLSAYVKGKAGQKISLQIGFREKEMPAQPQKKEGAPEEPPRFADETPVAEVGLDGSWQRVACVASCDMRLLTREVSFSIRSSTQGPSELLLDRLQLQQIKFYPQRNHVMPTAWMPGGTTTPASHLTIPADLARGIFPADKGAISFWTRTLRETNLDSSGGCNWIAYGYNWLPNWQVNTYLCSGAGEKVAYFGQDWTNIVCDGNWHHVAFSWSAEQGQVFLDGKPRPPFELKRAALPKELEQFYLRIGGYVPDGGGVANAIMDEIAIFRRPLGEEEVARIAASTAPLRSNAAPLAFSKPKRAVFHRDEEKAFLEIPVAALQDGIGGAEVDIEIGKLMSASSDLVLENGSGTVRQEFDPRKLACGKYVCRIGAKAGDRAAYSEFTIEVVPSLRPDQYLMSSWGGGGETAAWRELLRTMGLNCVDTYAINIEELAREGFQYCWHYNTPNTKGVASPENLAALRKYTQVEAGWRARFPSWCYTLLNSEVAPVMPGPEDRAAWFDSWAEKELGFPVPAGEKSWKLGTVNNPVMCWLDNAGQAGPDGVFKDCRNLAFLHWLYNRGCGWWRINTAATEEIRKLRPDVKEWTDPAYTPGQTADLDAGSCWSYHISPEPLIGELESSYASVRSSGKEFYVTLGMNYVKPFTESVTAPDGQPKCLAPTGDDMVQQAWIGVTAIASSGLTYWDLGGLFYGLRGEQKRYAEPDSDKRIGKALKEELFPIGTMLKKTPNAPRRIALLLPSSTIWVIAGETNWGWGVSHYTNQWLEWMGHTGQAYDIVTDTYFAPGALAEYDLIVFPMAQLVEASVHRELMAAAKSGAKIVVDSYCRQEYPGMIKLEQKYGSWEESAKPGYSEATIRRLTELTAQVKPKLEAFAKGSEGRVLVNTRAAGPARYVAVINDLRKDGPYTVWTGKPIFRPYGKPQRATVSIKAPADSAVYDFSSSKLLKTRAEKGRLIVDIDLPPHGGRLLCVRPARLDKIVLRQSENGYSLGTPGTIAAEVLDSSGQAAPGRQLLQVKITGPDGAVHDESGLYTVFDGRCEIPFRPAMNDKPGKWNIEATERSSGIKAAATIELKPE